MRNMQTEAGATPVRNDRSRYDGVARWGFPVAVAAAVVAGVAAAWPSPAPAVAAPEPLAQVIEDRCATSGLTFGPDEFECIQIRAGAAFATLAGTPVTWDQGCLSAQGYELADNNVLVPPGVPFDSREVWACATPDPTPEQCTEWGQALDLTPQGRAVWSRLGCTIA